MRSSKVVGSLEEVIKLTGLRDGMTISFHHAFRNGDYVLNLVTQKIAEMGFHDIRINATGVYDIHKPVIELMKKHIITGLETNYMMGGFGKGITEGACDTPVIFRSHGGRDAALFEGDTHVDVAFIAASTCDEMGNCNGTHGPSAFGALAYAKIDALKADKVVIVTDNLVPYPTIGISIPETLVDYVVQVDCIGDPNGIMSGPLSATADPVTTVISKMATDVIEATGLLKEGFAFQTGGGKPSVMVAKFLKEKMLKGGIQGSYIMGGVGKSHVDLLNSGCFRTIMDVQSFDLEGIKSVRENPADQEISIYQYASPSAKSCVSDGLDVTVVGATQIDTDFNINVHTNSFGYIIGGSGGHNDICMGAKVALAVAPLVRSRVPIVVDKVVTVSTPGEYVDILVTQRGVAVNPRRPELKEQLIDNGIKVKSIEELKEMAYSISGVPAPLVTTDIPVAYVNFRKDQLVSTIYKPIL